MISCLHCSLQQLLKLGVLFFHLPRSPCHGWTPRCWRFFGAKRSNPRYFTIWCVPHHETNTPGTSSLPAAISTVASSWLTRHATAATGGHPYQGHAVSWLWVSQLISAVQLLVLRCLDKTSGYFLVNACSKRRLHCAQLLLFFDSLGKRYPHLLVDPQ